ncbi:hypothetical protein L6R50_08340 [Myxococcota bacterium]|nr:hypothetical protein [Myxococcota bacterium]
MANTKKLPHDERKKARRAARKRIREAYAALTRKDRKALSKFEGPLTRFLREKAGA